MIMYEKSFKKVGHIKQNVLYETLRNYPQEVNYINLGITYHAIRTVDPWLKAVN